MIKQIYDVRRATPKSGLLDIYWTIETTRITKVNSVTSVLLPCDHEQALNEANKASSLSVVLVTTCLYKLYVRMNTLYIVISFSFFHHILVTQEEQ